MKIVTALEMREIDRVTSVRYGVPSLTLMETAGAAVAAFVLQKYPSAQRVGVICGKGNNGGDGFVAARKLVEAGRTVRVLLLADASEVQGDAAKMLRNLPAPPLSVRTTTELASEEAQAIYKNEVLIVDAILGTGFHPPMNELYSAAVAAVNKSSASVIAVDIPSGADADVFNAQTGQIARAEAIVTFTAPRPAHIFGNLTDGPIVISPIGSPDEAVISNLNLNVIMLGEIAPLIGPRRADSNKGSFGHVLVIGGSLGKSGASAMAAIAALRVGAGLSTVATPRSVLPMVAGFHPELMTEPLEETEAGSIAKGASKQISELAKNKTVIAMGPGISRHSETAECVRAVIKEIKSPVVLDADGLNAFEGHADELSGAEPQIVITPHPGEMARLVGLSITEVQRDRIKIARKFAADHNLIVVLKGHRTLIAKPSGEVWVNMTGNPGMATGGTGDVLTGMLAGMIAQFPDKPLDATIAAVHLHGLAGDVAKERMGEQCMVATDLITALPEAFRRAREAACNSICVLRP